MSIIFECHECHDLDYDQIDKIPSHQGSYDNGWQMALIWCCTHKREEWHWIDYNKIPERLRPDPQTQTSAHNQEFRE